MTLSKKKQDRIRCIRNEGYSFGDVARKLYFSKTIVKQYIDCNGYPTPRFNILNQMLQEERI